MKRLSVFLFLMMIVLCGLYGYSFFVFEKKQVSDDKDPTTTQGDMLDEETAKEKDSVHANTALEQTSEEAVRKASTSNVVNGAYLLKVEQNQMLVYQLSDQSIYMALDMTSVRLSDEQMKEYEKGIYVNDEQSLYRLLESISS